MNLPTALRQLACDFITIFSRKNLPWHALAIALTAILVLFGFDQSYYLATRSEALHALIYPAITGGFLLPLILPLVLFILSRIQKSRNLFLTAGALAEAELLGSLVSSIYKAFTGRFQPNWVDNGIDMSRQFHFGFWRHGIFWGWPSSHTTIAFAMALCLFTLFPKKKILRSVVLVYALYVGLGVSVSIHWFSDFIAGIIIGSVIGVTVGRSFLRYFKKENFTA